MWFNITQSLSGVAGKQKPDSTVKMYTGTSLADIIKNKTNKGITLEKNNQEFTLESDQHVLIVAVGA